MIIFIVSNLVNEISLWNRTVFFGAFKNKLFWLISRQFFNEKSFLKDKLVELNISS